MRHNLAWLAAGLLALCSGCLQAEQALVVPEDLPGGKTPSSYHVRDAVPANSVSSFRPAPWPPGLVLPKVVTPSPAFASTGQTKRPSVQPRLQLVTPIKAPPVQAPRQTARGHAPDHCWLVGYLCRDEKSPRWRVRYADVEENDSYGGSLELRNAEPPPGYLPGQLVRVEGDLLDPAPHEITPVYQVRKMELINP